MAQWDTWPTETEAAAQLATSVKSIARLAAKGKSEIRTRPRPGKKPENVCNPEDVQKLIPASRVMQPETEASTLAVRPKPGEPTWPVALETIATILTANRPREANPKLWLSVEEAAAESGLPKTVVRGAIEEEKLDAILAGAWYVRRASLEAFAG